MDLYFGIRRNSSFNMKLNASKGNELIVFLQLSVYICVFTVDKSQHQILSIYSKYAPRNLNLNIHGYENLRCLAYRLL
jgi:hypothetical protein